MSEFTAGLETLNGDKLVGFVRKEEVWHTEPPQRGGVYVLRRCYSDGTKRNFFSIWTAKDWRGLSHDIETIAVFEPLGADSLSSINIDVYDRWRELNASERAHLEQITGESDSARLATERGVIPDCQATLPDAQTAASKTHALGASPVAHQTLKQITGESASTPEGLEVVAPSAPVAHQSRESPNREAAARSARQPDKGASRADSLPSFHPKTREHVAAINSPAQAPREWLSRAMTGAHDGTT